MEDGQTNLEKYNPGSTGDVPRVVKTKQRILSYGDTPPDMRLTLFQKIADSCGQDKDIFARKLLKMSWNERMELLKVHYSSDKQVLNILDKASKDNADQEDEVDARKRSYGIMKHSERNIKKLKLQPSIKENFESKPCRNNEDYDSFYDDEDDDNLLSLAFNDERVSVSKKKKESTSSSSGTADSSSAKSVICKNLEPIVAKNESSIPLKPVKPAPPGQYYKKRIDTQAQVLEFCDNDVQKTQDMKCNHGFKDGTKSSKIDEIFPDSDSDLVSRSDFKSKQLKLNDIFPDSDSDSVIPKSDFKSKQLKINDKILKDELDDIFD